MTLSAEVVYTSLLSCLVKKSPFLLKNIRFEGQIVNYKGETVASDEWRVASGGRAEKTYPFLRWKKGRRRTEMDTMKNFQMYPRTRN
jgi:hypothetical protein